MLYLATWLLLLLLVPFVSPLSYQPQLSRRSAFVHVLTGGSLFLSQPVWAADVSTATAAVTDKIYLDIATPNGDRKRLAIGLFGKDAPGSVQKLKQLVAEGLPAACKPKAQRALQKEQLEANKVYNSCIESEQNGVSLNYSTVWRIRPGERIDVGAVTGKFVARKYPTFDDAPTLLRHDSPGVVSVRRGNESGFGFTIFPGGGDATALDQDHIVVGKVLPDSMETVEWLNATPVVTTSAVNYMALTGGAKESAAPDRSCRYGGPMYCNENKPLVKLTVRESGLIQ